MTLDGWTEKHVEEKFKNLPAITSKYDPIYEKHRYELVVRPNKQPNRRFLLNDLELKVIMDHRMDESCNLKRNFGFDSHDVINTKEQTVLKSIKDAFEGESMQTQHNVSDYRIDLYFLDYRLTIEADELGNNDRRISHGIQRQNAMEKERGCEFIRINPDEENFNTFKAINKTHIHIKNPTRKSLIDKTSKRLSELEFKLNHSIKSKCLKFHVKKLLPSL